MIEQFPWGRWIVNGLVSIWTFLGASLATAIGGWTAKTLGCSDFEVFLILLAAFCVTAVLVAMLVGWFSDVAEDSWSKAPGAQVPMTLAAAALDAPKRNRVRIKWSTRQDGADLRASITNLTPGMLYPPGVMNSGLPADAGVRVVVVAVRRWLEDAESYVDRPGIELRCSKRVRIRMDEPMFSGEDYGFPLLTFKPSGQHSSASITVVGRAEDERYPPIIEEDGRWKVTLRAEFPGHQETHELCFHFAPGRPPVPLNSCNR